MENDDPMTLFEQSPAFLEDLKTAVLPHRQLAPPPSNQEQKFLFAAHLEGQLQAGTWGIEAFNAFGKDYQRAPFEPGKEI